MHYFVYRNSLVRQTKDGNTSLHLSAQMNQTECMKLLLRTKPDIAHIKNNEGHTALDIATEKGYQLCAELVRYFYTVNSEIFARVLFSRNFTDAEFHENKSLRKWRNLSVMYCCS